MSGSDWLPRWIDGIGLPRLTREAEIAVYMVHNSDDPEDYFFLFDFEEFADRSKSGVFVRPVLRVFAGRDDFGRTEFAREFRRVFAREFDRMRDELAVKSGKRGWLDWNIGLGGAMDLVGGLVANVVLAIALETGRRVFSGFSLPSILRGKSDEAKLADEIERSKARVEAALARIEVTVHPELLEFAEREGLRLRRADVNREAWPLPAYVRRHLQDEESGSWW